MENQKLIKELLEFERVTLGNNLAEFIEYYKSLNHDFGVLIQEIFDQKEEWPFAGDLEGKLIRVYFQNESIIKIAAGHHPVLKGHQLEILDVSSIYALSRQLIESLLSTYYLFFDDISEDDRSFRILTYKLAGLIRQLDLVRHIDLDDHRLASLKGEYNEAIAQLSKLPVYKSADSKGRQKLENPRMAIVKSRDELINNLGMATIGKTWTLYSNYVHSEYISDRQYNTFYREKKGLVESICTTLNSNCRITAKLIQLMRTKFPYMQLAIEKFPEVNKLRIDAWNKISDALK